MKTLVPAVLFVCFAAGGVPAPAQVAAPSAPPAPSRVIRVTGDAEVGAEPDLASFEVGAEIQDRSASVAMSKLAGITDQLTAALRKQAIPPDAIETTQLDLFRSQEYVPAPTAADPNRREPRDVFRAIHHLRVEVGRDRFTRIGEILDAAMGAGGNFVSNVSFTVKDDSGMQNRGLAQATRLAAAKASVIAEAAGIHLGAVRSIEEGQAARPVPLFGGEMRAMSAAAPSPVPPSLVKRHFTVTLEYFIADR